jgi:hypothetical protein
VVCYTTKPAAGGMIASRGFVDLRLTVRADDAAAGTSRTVILNSEAPSPYADGWFALADKEERVRARNLAGSGVLLVERGGSLELTILTTSEIGGKVPAPVVNSATGGALHGILVGMADVFRKQSADVRVVGADTGSSWW